MVRLLLFIVFFINYYYASAQTEWELTKDRNEIKVYTAKQNSSKFRSIKVEAVFNGTLQKLVKILMDVRNNKNWVYGTKNSYPVKEVNAGEIFYYSETELPWPLSNRDVPIRMKLNLNTANNTLEVVAVGEPGAIPVQKGIVRIPVFNSSWNVKSDGKNRIFINYFLQIDPGGNVPPPVSNAFLGKGPLETFQNLQRLLKEAK